MSLRAADLADQIEVYVKSSERGVEDDATRRRLREKGRELSLAMEASGDTVHRISNTPLQLAIARIGVEKHFFEILAEVDNGVSIAELSGKTQIDPILTKRLLRYMESYGMISRPAVDKYAANNCTKAMASVGGAAGINYFFEMISQTFMAFPQFLRNNGYKNPSDPNDCPWHLGHKTTESPFPWLQSHPEYFDYFLPWMTAQRDGLPIFLDVYPFEEKHMRNMSAETPLFVDVGGAMGHQCVAVKQRFPDLTGRVILQEQSFVIDQVKESGNPPPGVDLMAYDFFTPQPVRGARTYYMRNVLHDWPDQKCKEILQNTMQGMTEDSVLLIDEMVLPETGTPWRAAQLDMAMMTCLAAMERSEAEWRQLLDEAGMKVVNIVMYTEECHDSIIVAVPK